MSTTISGTNGVTFPDSTSMQTGQQACKAWVNFNGIGTVAIRGSHNVSSITDNGTGDYTINFTTAMPNTNFAIVGSGNYGDEVNWRVPVPRVYSASSIRINTIYADANSNPTPFDAGLINVAVFSN